VPRSMIVPFSTVKMTSALRIVESRWAMAIVREKAGAAVGQAGLPAYSQSRCHHLARSRV